VQRMLMVTSRSSPRWCSSRTTPRRASQAQPRPRGHDLHRTFITLARADGSRADGLRPLTHPGEKDVTGLYSSFSWPIICAELAKLQLPLPSSLRVAPAAAVEVQITAPALVPPTEPEAPALAAIVHRSWKSRHSAAPAAG
jgi:hypothetical protein